MDKLDKECISPLKLFERLVRLETAFEVGCEKDARALVIARELLDTKLRGMNEFQKRIDRLEGTLVTEKELETFKKLIYVAVGLAMAASFVMPWLMMKAH